MNDLLDELKSRVLVSDGAMGTGLQKKGLGDDEVPEQWNVTKPQIVKDIHKSYIDAGSDLIVTNTFGANGFKLERKGLTDRVDYFNKKGAELALETAQNKIYVFGDIGPSGEFVQPYGDVKSENMYENFKQQVIALKNTGINGFILETFSDINELEICIKAVKNNSDLPVISSVTFEKMQDGSFKTMMGVSVNEVIEKCFNAGCSIIGTNCGNGSEEMLNIVKQFSDEREKYKEDLFIIAQPNAGKPVVKEGKTVFNETPDDFKKIIPEYLNLEVNIIGGCCGTTPEHIEVIKQLTAQS